MRTYIIAWIGHRHLAWLTDDDLSDHYGDLLVRGGHRRCVKKDHRCEPTQCDNGRPLSRTTVRLAHRVLHKALFDAYKILPINPADHARVPKKAKRAMSTWTEEELQRFLVAVAKDRLLAAWYLALTAGLRRGELAGLRWSDVRLNHRIISVVSQRLVDTDGEVIEKAPKGSSCGPVAIGPAAVEVLRAHKRWQQREKHEAAELWQDGDYVFTQENGEPYNPPALLRRFKRLCGKANVPVIRLHDARHTCATVALLAGVHPKVVQERLRHSSIKTTMDTYSHVPPSMQAGAAVQIEDIANGSTQPQHPAPQPRSGATQPSCMSPSPTRPGRTGRSHSLNRHRARYGGAA